MKTEFTKKEKQVLTEIYRRLNYFRKDLNDNLILLSFPSFAKAAIDLGLIEPSFKEIKKVLNWYKLTEKGKDFFKERAEISKSLNEDLFTSDVPMYFKYIKQ